MRNSSITNRTHTGATLGRKFFLATVLAFLCISPQNAAGATKSKLSYAAARLLQSAPRLSLAPGERASFMIAFKNTGTAVWQNSGPAYLSAYTDAPRYRKSAFYHNSWKSFRQAAVMKNESAAPGEVGFFELMLRAPETSGHYDESFTIAAEDAAWVKGATFTIPIDVTAPPAAQALPPPVAALPYRRTIPPPNSMDYQALRLSQSAPSLTLRPGEEQQFHILFKNVGIKSWQDTAIRTRENEPLTISTVTPTTLAFRHESWKDRDLALMDRNAILPGEVNLARFMLRAPEIPGSYVAKFQLMTNGIAASEGDFDIPITVTDAAGSVPYNTVPFTGAVSEPNVRIGLYTADAPITVVSEEQLEARTREGQILGHVGPGVPVTLSYRVGDGYRALLPSGATISSVPIRLVPTTPGVLTITNYTNRPKWSKTINDNVFRGSLELVVNSKGTVWVVNELPLEQYLRGLAETGNGSPSEYHKAIIIAARTYAYWHTMNPYKHEEFTIDAYWDQVYRGYNSETRMPNFVSSVEETRGMAVTYGNEIVVTPYFARSNGRTKTWRAVWGGADKPWIVSVPVPWDAGYRQLGHGVGMSATAAAAMAKEGKAYPEILKYFYTGTDLTRLW